jgi:hypothetical protein
VIRKGKEIGTTPLTLAHLAVDGTGVVELRLNGYAPAVDFALKVMEGVTTNLNAKLFSERYLQAMKHAQEALAAAQFSEARSFITTALESDPNDPTALKFRDEVEEANAKAQESLRTEQANAKARELAALTWLDFNKVVADCTDTRQVQNTVELADGYNQNYVDDSGRKRTRFVQTGTHTETRTSTVSEFSTATFSEKFRGKTFGFNFPTPWKVAKVEGDGTIILKGPGLLSPDRIRVSAPSSNPNALRALRKGQTMPIKGVLTKYESGFLGRTLFLENAEIIGDVR